MKKTSNCNKGCEAFLDDFDVDVAIIDFNDDAFDDVEVTAADFERQVIKTRRRNRIKKTVAYKKRLESRAEDAVTNFPKRWDNVYRHCYKDDRFKVRNAHHIAKKCKFMGNEVVDSYFAR